jgi:hypothetical protein
MTNSRIFETFGDNNNALAIIYNESVNNNTQQRLELTTIIFGGSYQLGQVGQRFRVFDGLDNSQGLIKSLNIKPGDPSSNTVLIVFERGGGNLRNALFTRAFNLTFGDIKVPDGTPDSNISLEPTNGQNLALTFLGQFRWFIAAYRDQDNQGKGALRLINIQEQYLAANNNFNIQGIAETSAAPGQFVKARVNFFGK